MNANFIMIVLLVMGITSCGSPVMDSEEIKAMVLGENRGVVADIEIGDKWEDVKSNMHKSWELDEESHQFKKMLDDFNNVILTVGVDDEDVVRSLTLVINGKKGNHLLIAEVKNALEKRFNEKFTVNTPGESWDYAAPNGDLCGALMHVIDQADTGSKSLSVDIYNSTAML